ncbi:MAG TPA: hypothetical protein VI912_04465 [Candidatus Bilamarchaeaceae archaeon]|nr:hypothetical protein [Candidatus Bilamarchaeaceae archaeon]
MQLRRRTLHTNPEPLKPRVVDLDRKYTLSDASEITGFSIDKLRRRLRSYKEAFRDPFIGHLLIGGETVFRILTGIGTKWEDKFD